MINFISSIFRYINLKTKVSFARLFIWWKGGWPKAFPNSILQIPSRDRGRTIKAHVYGTISSEKPGPVLINLHGSGFVFPLHGSDDKFCRLVSDKTNNTVLDIQYRLAPEHPWPAAVDDAEDVVRYVLQRPQKFDPSRISISGFSAGANLSLVQAGVIFPKDTFRSMICFYPPTDLSIEPGDKVAPDPSGHPIPPAMARTFDACYRLPGTDSKDPRISPVFAPTETYPQNVLMISCACDSLCDEAERVATNIEAAGGDRNVVRQRMEHCDHAWDKSAKGAVQKKARDDAYALAVEMLTT